MAAMEGNCEDSGDVGAEVLRRASVLRPLLQMYLSRTGSLESGIRDAFRKHGVSKATVWRWVRRIADEGGRTSAMVARKHCRPSGTVIMPIEVDAVIGGYLARDYLRRERPGLARVVTEIRIA